MKYVPSENALLSRKRESIDSSQLVKYLSQTRLYQLENYYKNNSDILELEKKFGKYILVPLAVPLFELPDKDKFLAWWKKYSIRPIKAKGDYVADITGYSPFESIDLIHKTEPDFNLNLQTENFKNEFPHLYQQFFDCLPFEDILFINLWSSVQEFPEHRDSTEMVDFPCSIRIKLYDENPEETLFVLDNPTSPYYCTDATFLPRLEKTNTYAWNNLRCMHGSVYDTRYKKILAIVGGLVNVDKYELLINQSTKQFEANCIVSNFNLENYVSL